MRVYFATHTHIDEKLMNSVKLLYVEKINASLQANSKANIDIYKSIILPMYPKGNYSLTKTRYIYTNSKDLQSEF